MVAVGSTSAVSLMMREGRSAGKVLAGSGATGVTSTGCLAEAGSESTIGEMVAYLARKDNGRSAVCPEARAIGSRQALLNVKKGGNRSA